MFLLSFEEFQAKGKSYRIINLFDPNAQRKVITKFLRPDIQVPKQKVITAKDLEDFEQVDVQADLNGNVISIS